MEKVKVYKKCVHLQYKCSNKIQHNKLFYTNKYFKLCFTGIFFFFKNVTIYIEKMKIANLVFNFYIHQNSILCETNHNM